MGQIIGSAAKPKRCNANQLSQVPTPAAGEHILVSSDNSMNAAGQGNFDVYIVGDGTKAATALPLQRINGALEERITDIETELNGGESWVDVKTTAREVASCGLDYEGLPKTTLRNNTLYYVSLDGGGRLSVANASTDATNPSCFWAAYSSQTEFTAATQVERSAFSKNQTGLGFTDKTFDASVKCVIIASQTSLAANLLITKLVATDSLKGQVETNSENITALQTQVGENTEAIEELDGIGEQVESIETTLNGTGAWTDAKTTAREVASCGLDYEGLPKTTLRNNTLYYVSLDGGGRLSVANASTDATNPSCFWAAYSSQTEFTAATQVERSAFSKNQTGLGFTDKTFDASVKCVIIASQTSLAENLTIQKYAISGSLIGQVQKNSEDIAAIKGELSESNTADVDVTNYGLLVELMPSKAYDANGELIDSTRTATSLALLDKDYNMYFGTSSPTNVHFFDANKNYISSAQGQFSNEFTEASSRMDVLRTSYPSGAFYVAFDFDPTSLLANAFYVSTTPNFICSNRYSTIIKRKGERPRIHIFTTDTEVEIFEKMLNAWLTRDCDVIWQCGSYTFSTIFAAMSNYSGYTGAGALEIVIGGNCRYYFNNSVITANRGETTAIPNLFGNRRTINASYELHDGTLVGNNTTYVVHDEGQGQDDAYVHIFKNIRMKYVSGADTNGISKCIGGGTGLHGQSVIDGCYFESDNTQCSSDVSYHGHTSAAPDAASEFKLFVLNSYMSKGLELQTLANNETAVAQYFGNYPATLIAKAARWTLYGVNGAS